MKVLSFCAIASSIVLMASGSVDEAVLNGSRNSVDYQIVVRSDGSAAITSQVSGLRRFTLPDSLVNRFFEAIAASQSNPWTSGPCVKHAPLDSTIHVTWHDWTSDDVACPTNSMSPGAEHAAVLLNNTVMAIVVYAGLPAAFHCYDLPVDKQPPGCH